VAIGSPSRPEVVGCLSERRASIADVTRRRSETLSLGAARERIGIGSGETRVEPSRRIIGPWKAVETDADVSVEVATHSYVDVLHIT
jgi:hypothetical protein